MRMVTMTKVGLLMVALSLGAARPGHAAGAAAPPAREAAAAQTPAAEAPGLTIEQAVAIALQKNRDVIAAKMEIEAAQLDVVAARIYPNPTAQVGVGNLVLGKANDQMGQLQSQPGCFGQPVISAGISEIIDVWSKRGARIRAADRGVEQRRYLTEDAILQAVSQRLRPVLMTALLASLGLLPAALSHAIGSATQRPFAIVIIGGLVTSTLLTMLLLPTLYKLAEQWFGRKSDPEETASLAPAHASKAHS